jgi:hypothetical protein
MSTFAALDVSQEATAICIVDDAGRNCCREKDTNLPGGAFFVL